MTSVRQTSTASSLCRWLIAPALILGFAQQAHAGLAASPSSPVSPSSSATVTAIRVTDSGPVRASAEGLPSARTCPGASEALAHFDRLDRNRDGTLTTVDLRRREIRRDRPRIALTDRLAQRLDLNGDGRAERQELLSLWPCPGRTSATHPEEACSQSIAGGLPVRPGPVDLRP